MELFSCEQAPFLIVTSPVSGPLFCFTLLLKYNFTIKSRVYSSMNLYICRHCVVTIQMKPIFPLGFLLPPLGQYLHPKVTIISISSIADSLYLGLSSCWQTRKLDWPPPGPAPPSLTICWPWILSFWTSLGLGICEFVLCFWGIWGAACPWCFVNQHLDVSYSKSQRLGPPSPSSKPQQPHVTGPHGEHWVLLPSPTWPTAKVHSCQCPEVRRLKTSLRSDTLPREVQGLCCDRDLLSLACLVIWESQRGLGHPGDGLCVLARVPPSPVLFPTTFVAKEHRLDGLNNRNVLSHGARGPEVQDQGVIRAMSL